MKLLIQLSHPNYRNRVIIVLRELLAADTEGTEGIRAVGVVFQQFLLRFGLLLHTFVLAEAGATALHSGGMDGEDEVGVVLPIEVRHEPIAYLTI